MTFDKHFDLYLTNNQCVWPKAFGNYLNHAENLEDINVKLNDIKGFNKFYSDFVNKTNYLGTEKEFEFELEKSNYFREVLFYGV